MSVLDTHHPTLVHEWAQAYDCTGWGWSYE